MNVRFILIKKLKDQVNDERWENTKQPEMTEAREVTSSLDTQKLDFYLMINREQFRHLQDAIMKEVF